MTVLQYLKQLEENCLWLGHNTKGIRLFVEVVLLSYGVIDMVVFGKLRKMELVMEQRMKDFLC